MRGHDLIFSDIVSHILEGKMTATVEHDTDEFGNPNVTVTQGPVELHLYTSEHDGLVVEVNYTQPESGEDIPLRVYLNDTTLYDSNSGE